MENGLKKAIQAAGNKSKLARKLDLTKGYISRWDAIPLKWVKRVSEVTGLPAEQLHPDFQIVTPDRR
ncbi:MAG: helix-turn-helix domain-containing protein [Rhizobiales bacterium]|nr:helix-turn-helix domain-containing protein [Hyphomicrobiales bacterium]